MSLDHKDAVGIDRALWPNKLDVYSEEVKKNQPPAECAVLWLHEGRILFRCEDPYYVGGLSDEAVMQLLRMCATVVAAGKNKTLFDFGEEQSILSVRNDGSINISHSDPYYNGQIAAEEAFELAVAVLKDKT